MAIASFGCMPNASHNAHVHTATTIVTDVVITQHACADRMTYHSAEEQFFRAFFLRWLRDFA